jgi:ssDNA-binding Zn-finger/Zn-ribbon topoisomerase 1
MTVSVPRGGTAGAATETERTCPVCLSPMELRRTGTDPQSGTWFWGCSRFPHCRGMISAPQPAPVTRRDHTPTPVSPAVAARTRGSGSPTGLFALVMVLILITLVAIILLGVTPAMAMRI